MFTKLSVQGCFLTSVKASTCMIKSIRHQQCRMQSSQTVESMKAILKSAQAVCFDVGSTVVQGEAIDELAEFKGVGDAVSKITVQAMGGSIPFKDALTARLKLIQPSSRDLADCLSKNPPRISPSVEKVISKLHSKGVHVYLITGGFRQMTNPVADLLKVPFNRVFANNLVFDGQGNYLGFDSEEYTCRDGGKPAVIQYLKNVHGYSSVIMVGDGVTDMQAKPPASAFIGFGGVNERPAVKAGADWYITDFEEMLALLR